MSGAELGFFADSESVQWYRGMSLVQTGACDRLLHALRDDMEQESTYRVRRCISQLGLHPMVKSCHIRDIMTISQGNDLAFLWFLWESAYKKPRTEHDPEPTPYSVNEQLLLSGIAYLDMPATLRALDSLLPPPSQSTKFRQKIESRKSSVKLRRPKKKEYASPYFAPQVQPRLYKPKGKIRPYVDKLQFPDYEKYLNGTEKIPNEDSRWFSQYKLCPAKRIIKKLLEDEFNRLTLDPALIRKTGQKQSPLCETHQFLEDVVTAERQKNVQKVLQRCLSKLDIPGAELKARRERIVKQMEKDIDYAADRIRGDSLRLRTQAMTLREFNGECLLCNNDVSVPTGKINKKANLSMLLGLGHEAVSKVHTYPIMANDFLKVMLINNDKELAKTGDCRYIPADCLSVSPKKVNVIEKEAVPTKDHFPKLADLIPHCTKTLPCPKKKKVDKPDDEDVFVTQNMGELAFDYEKIFKVPGIPVQHLPWEDELPDLEDKQPMIEDCCISALNEGNTKMGKECSRDSTLPPVLRAAANCAVDTFRAYIDEVARGARKARSIEDATVELIDPNNKQQIEKLLKVALEVLSHNPHYVLATFPNAHKLPVLIDWVADRYGKTFSREEMHALVKRAFRIYESIYQGDGRNQTNDLNLKKEMMVMGNGGYVTYHRVHEFMCQAKRMKADYHENLNQLALEQSRLTWLALRGYSHLGGHIKDTFFAYMPARMQDLKRQHVWRSTDFRNMVKFRIRERR
ncbi:hypothetical protein KR074_006033 [Drosophila pseudoananassae]|nr:hypothetical protein KR074_006033 [Drosophila pseudoananassae]